jgi:hypothetical protein
VKVIFDHNTPDGLAQFLPGHEITFCRTMGWAKLGNGFLIATAEKAAFDLMVTCDKNIRYQQNLTSRTISLVELTTNHWPSIRIRYAVILSEVNAAKPGSYAIVNIARLPKRKR